MKLRFEIIPADERQPPRTASARQGWQRDGWAFRARHTATATHWRAIERAALYHGENERTKHDE